MGPEDGAIDRWLMDEIRLDDEAFDAHWRKALLHILALDDAERQGITP